MKMLLLFSGIVATMICVKDVKKLKEFIRQVTFFLNCITHPYMQDENQSMKLLVLFSARTFTKK